MKMQKEYFLYAAFLLALISTLGSLYFSEILKFPPCVLCWHQRIAMYPLVPLLGIGILVKDKKIFQYVLPLSIAGLVIGLYHNLLYYHLIPESIQPCINGVSCTTKFIEWFGFITIPFLSLASFVMITALMYLYKKSYDKRS